MKAPDHQLGSPIGFGIPFSHAPATAQGSGWNVIICNDLVHRIDGGAYGLASSTR